MHRDPVCLTGQPRREVTVLFFALAGLLLSARVEPVAAASVSYALPAAQVAEDDAERIVNALTKPAAPPTDSTRAGRFDNGRMWTFEYPPLDYFEETYGFRPDSVWMRKARLGALRIPSCSASFISPNGLVMTNHHCGREHVSAVSRDGETLLDDGFYAARLEDERPVEGFEADRLIAIVDITDEVRAAEGEASTETRGEAREAALEVATERIQDEYGGEEAGIVAEGVTLYNGGRYSAYVFRRYTDVRLVMAPELKMGYFGGDPDNFTYPRYSLDMSFFRVWVDEQPLDTSDNYFSWSEEGVSEGEPVFIVGNPGSTTRIQTVAELEFRRDVSDRGVLAFMNRRISALEEFYEMDPVAAEALDIRNDIFSLVNSRKAYEGILRGLDDPVILAKKRDAERRFREAIDRDTTLSRKYSGLLERMAEIQETKRTQAPAYGAFLGLDDPDLGSATLVRALYAFQILSARANRAPEDVIDELMDGLLEVPQRPAGLEEFLIEARLLDIQHSHGEDSPIVQTLLGGRSPEGVAAAVVATSVLVDSIRAVEALEANTLDISDQGIQLFVGMLQSFVPFQRLLFQVADEEEEIAVDLGRARFDIYGSSVPPDATFSLRIADGIVQPYEYNGTRAPAFTTFYGLYDRYYSHGRSGSTEWELPERWETPPTSLDLSTPFVFVSTVDIIGGNSGSPVLNRDLEVVGLAFDGNIESLAGDYIFQTEFARTVSVDARGILAALAEVYHADRIVEEIRTGITTGR